VSRVKHIAVTRTGNEQVDIDYFFFSHLSNPRVGPF
jgi:hypothetical protein